MSEHPLPLERMFSRLFFCDSHENDNLFSCHWAEFPLSRQIAHRENLYAEADLTPEVSEFYFSGMAVDSKDLTFSGLLPPGATATSFHRFLLFQKFTSIFETFVLRKWACLLQPQFLPFYFPLPWCTPPFTAKIDRIFFPPLILSLFV